MAIENVPLMFGYNSYPIGRVSIFDEEVEQFLIKNVKAILEGRKEDVVRLELSIGSNVKPSGIQISAFGISSVPMLKKEQ